MSFNTSDVKEMSTSKYLKAGIENKVVIDNIKGEQPQDRSPFIEFTFRKPEGKTEDGTRVRFYMSEKAKGMSLQKILHLATKVVKRAQIDALNASSVEEYGAMLNKLLRNKMLRIMFSPEEYQNSSGEIKIKPALGLPEFAEAIAEGAESAPVADGDTKLVYNENKLLIKARGVQVPQTEDTVLKDDDLPF